MNLVAPRHRRIVVLGNGPSLRGFDLTSLKSVDALGMNAAYRFWERIGWYPAHYVCLDDQLIESHADAIHDMVVTGKVQTAFLITRILDFHPDLAGRDNVFFLESFNRTRQGRVAHRGVPFVDALPFRESDPSKVTTGAYAIRYAAHLGYDDIAVLGVDLRYVEVLPEARRGEGIRLEMVSTPRHNPNYFFDDYQRAGDKFNVPNPSSHARNLHVAAFEVLANDMVQFGWSARVWNANRQSVLHDKAIFPFAEIGGFIRPRSLGAVVVPTTTRELPRVMANLAAWDHPRLAPSTGALAPDRRPDLIVVFGGEEDDGVRQQILGAFGATRHVRQAFASVQVCFIGLSRHLDYYERDYTRKVGGRGFKSGPNEQFFETMELMAGQHDFIFYMEADCVPLRQGWLDRVRALAEGDPESWVIGGLYRGDEPIDDRFFLHLNGNALYRVGDPGFMEFVRRWWRPTLYEHLESADKRMAYDCLLSQVLSDARPSERNGAWQLFQNLGHRLRASGVIQNISGAADRACDPAETVRRLLVEHDETYLVHGASFVDALHAALAAYAAQPGAGFAWSEVLGEVAGTVVLPPWEQAVERTLPRLLVIDATAIGSRSATGQIKELFLRGWPRDRLLQVLDTPHGPHLKAFTPGLAPPPAGDLDAIVAACEAFDPQVIYMRPTDAMPMFAVLQALQRRARRPLLVHMMDDWPERSRFEAPTAFAALDTALREAIACAHGCLSISGAMSVVYRERYAAHFVPLANGVDVGAVPTHDHDARGPVSGERPFVVRYMGGLARDMTFDSVVDVARAVSRLSARMPVRMEVCTMPWYRDEAAAALSGLAGVSLHDLVDAEHYPALLADSDALVIAYNFDEPTRRYVGLSLANKLPECLASGVPLLAYGPETIATIDELAKAGCACLVTRRDPAALEAAIRSLVESATRCRELGEAGRQHVAEHRSDQRAIEGFRSAVRRAMLRFQRQQQETKEAGTEASRLATPASTRYATVARSAPAALAPRTVGSATTFAEANRMLRAGQFAQALACYRRLHQERPLPVYAQNAKLAEALLAATRRDTTGETS